jgi:hypothetical protein
MMKLQQIWNLSGRALVGAIMVGMITSAAAAQASKTDKTIRVTPLKNAETKDTDEGHPPANIDGSLVILQGLDKETARIQTFGGKVGSVVTFRTLEIAIRRCQKTPPQLKPEKAAFLQIYDVDPETKKKKMVFSGWMFASSPALSAMDHPTYDIWVKDCR